MTEEDYLVTMAEYLANIDDNLVRIEIQLAQLNKNMENIIELLKEGL